MKVWAISDLHLGYKENRAALTQLPAYPDDWLILAGDIGEKATHLEFCYRELVPRFAKLIWVPGNHELWTMGAEAGAGEDLRGDRKYQLLVELARHHGVLTPEDPFAQVPTDGQPTVIAPCFVGYDYSFSPDGFTPERAVQWARETGIRARDEDLLHADPYDNRQTWCHARVAYTEERLQDVPKGTRIVLVNHWPLRRDLVRLFRIPRYAPWCGTRLTEDWHQRFDVTAVVSGHLHMRATDWRHGVRFEEVSIGYPRHWNQEQGMAHYLREILPGPSRVPPGLEGPTWHR